MQRRRSPTGSAVVTRRPRLVLLLSLPGGMPHASAAIELRNLPKRRHRPSRKASPNPTRRRPTRIHPTVAMTGHEAAGEGAGHVHTEQVRPLTVAGHRGQRPSWFPVDCNRGCRLVGIRRLMLATTTYGLPIATLGDVQKQETVHRVKPRHLLLGGPRCTPNQQVSQRVLLVTLRAARRDSVTESCRL
jgi:hypothetical protein